jgi:hypothetical protein
VNIQLRALTWRRRDVCTAVFEMPNGAFEEVVFTLDRLPIGIGATPEPNILWTVADGSAAEVRALVRTVVRFCLTAQGELPEGDD